LYAAAVRTRDKTRGDVGLTIAQSMLLRDGNQWGLFAETRLFMAGQNSAKASRGSWV
jgi:hypothetical protein